MNKYEGFMIFLEKSLIVLCGSSPAYVVEEKAKTQFGSRYWKTLKIIKEI